MFQQFENQHFIDKYFSTSPLEFDYSIDNREFWEKAEKGIPQRFYSLSGLFDNIEPLTASMYMGFEKNIDRQVFEKAYFKRRRALMFYTFSEAIENKGKHLDRIVDLIWMILEETTWAPPAHAILSPHSDALPDVNDEILDLFAAETGAALCFVCRVLEKRLDKISRNITPYIKKELKRRVIGAYMSHNHYGWMGFDGNRVNNWNPWIHSNVLRVMMLVCDTAESKKLVLKAMRSLDCYADGYPEDGACEEGPMYWFMAGITLLECLEIFYRLSDKHIDVFSLPKVKNILHFFRNICISGDRVINFADAPSRYICDYGVLYHFARLTNDKPLINFCAVMYKEFCDSVTIPLQEPFRMLNLIEANIDLEGFMTTEVTYPKDCYFSSTQLMIKRSGSLFAAAKGGHNDESHNHNDIGSFMIYKNGVPFVIDAGYKQYTKDTFSERRYTIWTNCSEFHNLPEIGGKNQHDGIDYRSDNTSYSRDRFELDIQNAYENRDDIVLWRRSFDFNGDSIVISEAYEFVKPMEIILNFMLAEKPSVRGGSVMLCRENESLTMEIDTSGFDILTEPIVLADAHLEHSWGEKLYRVRMKKKSVDTRGKIVYKFY